MCLESGVTCRMNYHVICSLLMRQNSVVYGIALWLSLIYPFIPQAKTSEKSLCVCVHLYECESVCVYVLCGWVCKRH